MSPEQEGYELLDFGAGRRLERFGGVVVDRPCPAAENHRRTSSEWKATVRYSRRGSAGTWSGATKIQQPWVMELEAQCFHLQLTDSGQVGVFPEQAENWKWIRKKLVGRPECRILNLFAYTGGSTIAAALAGASVTHVDSARSVVNRARKNAVESGLANSTIRWIVEDAPKFVAREVKRGNRYDGIILDPPSYGHGPKNEEWKLSRDLFGLLQDCARLLTDRPGIFLLSCHTPGFGAPELSAAVSTCLFGSCGAGVRTQTLSLIAADGRRLSAGAAALWP